MSAFVLSFFNLRGYLYHDALTGGLDEMLNKIADFYDEEVDEAVTALTSIIEPIIIVIMGAVIGGILVAMYLPMFDIIGKI